MAQEDRSTLISRIGTFFIILGIFAIILFVASDIIQQTNCAFFLTALTLLGIGWILKRKGATPPQPDKRFQGLRNWRQSRRDAKAKNEKDKKR